jgi:hypothetical protein
MQRVDADVIDVRSRGAGNWPASLVPSSAMPSQSTATITIAAELLW